MFLKKESTVLSVKSSVNARFLIHAIRTMLTRKRKKFRLLCFTGVASFLIQGSTIHRTMALPYYYRNSSPRDNLKAAQSLLKGVDYFIFDEMSMIGLHLFGYISERMKAVFNSEEDFGGKHCILTGDWGQVRPVADFPLFRTDTTGFGALENFGKAFYQKFDKCVFLDEQMRQVGEGEEKFRNLLSHVRVGEISEEEVGLLNTRFAKNFDLDERKEFLKGACFLFGENKPAAEYNMLRIKNLGTPIIEIKDKVTKMAPEGSEKSLFLAVNARVMLTVNIWVEASLYNGSIGTVTEIGEIGKDGRPSVVFIRFEKYMGPRYLLRDDIPIAMHPFPMHDSVSGRNWTRLNFPLINAFGITVHKSQGCTLKRVCIGLPSEDTKDSLFYKMSPALIFVALSRVRALRDLAINRLFDPAIVTYAKGRYFREWNNEEKRLRMIEASM